MAFQTKKSVLALVPEVTEATPVAPTSASQYTALQNGFSMTPAFSSLTNEELTGSIGQAKTIQGFEEPSMEVSHYIKGQGVEGTAPDYSILLEAAFGAKSTASTQYDTVASSTVSVVKVDTGEGATFERGEMLLIKDPVNGYNIRPILSISSNDLSLGFQLDAAPGTGVNLGKCVLYKPGESHPTFSSWLYRANGGAVELMAGSRVVEMGMEVAAGELINASFSAEGVSYYFDPMEITATDTKLDFLDDATTRVATIAAGFYKDPHDLASAVATAMNSLGSGNTFTCSYSNSSGKFTITSDGTTLSLLWNTGANAANTIGDKLGFSTAADDTGALTYTSDNAITLTAPQTPSYDSTSPLVAKYNEVLLGDSTDATPACFSAQNFSFTLSDEKADILALCAESGKSGSVIVGRTATVDILANFTQYDAEQFKRFRTSQSISFFYAFGEKSGGNWVAGKAGGLYLPTATISSFELTDTDGLVTLQMTLTAYVASGLGEVYLGFV